MVRVRIIVRVRVIVVRGRVRGVYMCALPGVRMCVWLG